MTMMMVTLSVLTGIATVIVAVAAIMERFFRSDVLMALGRLFMRTADVVGLKTSLLVRLQFGTEQDMSKIILTKPFITILLLLMLAITLAIYLGVFFVTGIFIFQSLTMPESLVVVKWLWCVIWAAVAIIFSSWAIPFQIRKLQKKPSVLNVLKQFVKNYAVVGIYYPVKYGLILLCAVILMLPAWAFKIDVNSQKKRNNYYIWYAVALGIMTVFLTIASQIHF